MPFHVYIISNKARGVLYIGVTNSLARRIYEHRQKLDDGFSSKYNLTRLFYVEEYKNSLEAIAREKQLKNWHRDWKLNLIEAANPDWEDLYEHII